MNSSITPEKVIKSQEKRAKEKTEKDCKTTRKQTNKMSINTYLSIDTLSVNGLNLPIKKHRVAEWTKNKIHLYAAYKRFSSHVTAHTD